MDVLKYADINPNEAKHQAQKLHRKKDDINLVRKFINIDKVEAIDEERSIVARVSTNDRDRDGEIVEPKGIDLSGYTKNPCLLWAHRYDMPAIGKALWSKTDDKGLICKFQFAPTEFASEIYELYKGGYQRTFSIGFIPVDFDSVEKVHRKISLLEVSAVPVPCNENATVMEAYRKGIIKSDQLKDDLKIEGPAPVPEVHTTVCEKDTDVLPLTADAVQPKIDFCETCGTALGVKADVNKIVDAENNPSLPDLFQAITDALNKPSQALDGWTIPSNLRYIVQDVFPTDFPSGHCVYVEYLSGREVNPSYRQDYTFSEDRAILMGERYEVVVAYRNKEADVIFKPETTDSYHRIPVSTGHEGHRIRTITISADQGIKALYCGECKEVVTYLFDVDKWSMAEAEKWVEDHKKMRFILGHRGLVEFCVYANETEVQEAYGCPRGNWITFLMMAEDGQAREVTLTDEDVHSLDLAEAARLKRHIKESPTPDVAAELASLRADVAAILAMVQANRQAIPPTPIPAVDNAVPPIPLDDIEIEELEPEPDFIAFEPSAPPKAIDIPLNQYVASYIQSDAFKAKIKEAIDVALAKIRGRVI